MATKEQVVADRTFATERYILSTMPVLYLPLWKTDSGESGDSFISSDGHGFTCTVTGALWTPTGRVFDGSNDNILISSHASLNPEKLSVEFWVYINAHADFNSIVAKDYSGANNYRFLSAADGTLTWALRDKNGTSNWEVVTAPVNSGEWIHVVGVADQVPTSGVGGIVGIYINSALIKADLSHSVTEILHGSNANDLYVGFTSNALDGRIGEVRIYNRILTPLEIQRSYLATKWRYQ
ncbi:hypothetical protein LCGC14_0385240 [marine sediment metagenome]|uniref:LamG-like jellyroll fold domain-containing protein n=1 Tax=marine sediment metagenome TaxID=412755 RepID=A0A0F9TJE4_9ZZZZ